MELAGALKNVVAIAAGAADGLGFGDNGKAGLLTRGLAEMMRLGIAAGANALTFAGLAGIGDLIATCGSRLSRNHQLGSSSRPGGRGPRSRGRWRNGRGRLHRSLRARPGRSTRGGDADRPRGRTGAVRGQERAALPGRPALRESKDELADADAWLARLGVSAAQLVGNEPLRLTEPAGRRSRDHR